MTEDRRFRKNAFALAARPYFEEAEQLGFPVFLTAVADSSPLNASPYLAGYEKLKELAARWRPRHALLVELEDVRTRSQQYGIAVEAILIGGSFTEFSKPAPGDIDCVMFYRQAHVGEPVDAKGLADLRRRAIRRMVDVRFLPLDGDPLALVKSLCYFTILFSKDKHAVDQADVRLVRGLLLLDCRS